MGPAGTAESESVMGETEILPDVNETTERLILHICKTVKKRVFAVNGKIETFAGLGEYRKALIWPDGVVELYKGWFGATQKFDLGEPDSIQRIIDYFDN